MLYRRTTYTEFLTVTIAGELLNIQTAAIFWIRELANGDAEIFYNDVYEGRTAIIESVTYSDIVGYGLTTHVEVPVVMELNGVTVIAEENRLVLLQMILTVQVGHVAPTMTDLLFQKGYTWVSKGLILNHTVDAFMGSLEGYVEDDYVDNGYV